MNGLPQNWTDLYNLIANPVTFGILISMILGSLAIMKTDATWKDKSGQTVPVPSSVKMGIVLAACLAWSVLITLLNPAGFTPDKTTAYNVLLLTFTVALSSQIWHSVVSPFIAQIISILFGIAATLQARAGIKKFTAPDLELLGG